MLRCPIYGPFQHISVISLSPQSASQYLLSQHLKDVDGDQALGEMDNPDSCNFLFHNYLNDMVPTQVSWMPDMYKACRVIFKSSPFSHFQGRQGARNFLQLLVYELLREIKRLLRSSRLIVPALHGFWVNVCILSDFMHMWRSAVPVMHGGWHAVARRMGSTVVIGKLLMSWLSTVYIM